MINTTVNEVIFHKRTLQFLMGGSRACAIGIQRQGKSLLSWGPGRRLQAERVRVEVPHRDNVRSGLAAKGRAQHSDSITHSAFLCQGGGWGRIGMGRQVELRVWRGSSEARKFAPDPVGAEEPLKGRGGEEHSAVFWLH